MSERFSIPLRWRDLDHLGHVYHATILTMLDEARTRWLSSLGVGEPDSYVLARIELDYRRPLQRQDDALAVHFTAVRVGTSSVTISEQAFAAASSALVTESTSTIVMWDIQAAAKRPISPTERRALTGDNT